MEEDRPLFDKQDNTKSNGAIVTTAFRPRLLYSAIVSFLFTFLSALRYRCRQHSLHIDLRDSLIDTNFCSPSISMTILYI